MAEPTPAGDRSTATPLAVLAETWPLSEVLVLCFNANLGFFERAALARARSRGARVTVVADAAMVHADPDAVRFAGRAYLDGRAVCLAGGAFHPKLLVAAGPDQVAVLVGSGNASPGGWIDNAEIWTLLRADTDTGPAALLDIARFLEDLPGHVRLSPGVSEVLGEVAARLRACPSTEPGPAVVSTVWGPIIDQLPSPVDGDGAESLLVAVPFHDRPASALDALCRRLHPKTVEVAVQDATNFDGAALARRLASVNGTVSWIASSRYHHGKLVEWATAAGRFTLTGSANASAAALLKGMGDGGNCELGLVTQVPGSLRPPTLAEAPIPLEEHTWSPPAETAGQATVALLGAVLDGSGLRVLLRRPLAAPAPLEYYATGRWFEAGTVPAGVDEATLDVALPGATALRIIDGTGAPSNVVWVTDPVRTRFRHVAVKRDLPPDVVEVALDPRLVTMVETALAAVRGWAGANTSAGAGAGAPSVGYATHRTEGWREYIDAFRAEVGDRFGFFVLPHLMTEAGADTTTSDATAASGGAGDGELVDAGPGGPGPEEPPEPGEDVTARLAAPGAAERIARYRRLCEKLSGDRTVKPPPVQIATATLAIGGVALGCWKRGAATATALRASLRPLRLLADVDEFAPDAASAAAVGLFLLRAQVSSLGAGDEAAVAFRQTARELGPLLAHADADNVAYRCKGVVGDLLAPALEVERIMAVVGAAVRPDAMAEAVEILAAEHNTEADIDGQVIRLTEPVKGDARLSALRAVALAQDAAPVGAAATGPGGVGAAVWSPPNVYLVRWTAARRWIVGYRLREGSRPNDYVRTEGNIPSRLETGNWYETVPDAVGAAFAAVGLSLDEPPFPLPVAAPRAKPGPIRTGQVPPPSATGQPRLPDTSGSVDARTRPTTAARTRRCPACGMQKANSQFTSDAAECVDCR